MWPIICWLIMLIDSTAQYREKCERTMYLPFDHDLCWFPAYMEGIALKENF